MKLILMLRTKIITSFFSNFTILGSLAGIGLFFSCSLSKIDPPNVTGNCPDEVKINAIASPCTTPCSLEVTNATTNSSDFSFEWLINDSIVSTNVNLGSYDFSIAGTYQIKLIGTCKTDQTTKEDIETLVVNSSGNQSKPDALFEVSDSTNNGYAPATFCFTNQSSQADSYMWNFNDPTSADNTSEEVNLCHLFENAGIYQVTLIASNSSSLMSDTFSLSINVRDVLTFMAEYGGGEEDVAYSIIETNDNNFAIAGYTESFTNGGKDMYIILTNGMGTEINSNNFGGLRDEEAMSLIEKDGGGYILVGYTESFSEPEGNDNEDGYVIITDQNGNMEGNYKTIGKPRRDELHSIKKSSNGYAIVGFGSATGLGSGSYLLSVVDNNGFPITGFQDAKYFGSDDENDVALDLFTTSNEFAIVGYTYTYGGGVGYMIITTQNGQELTTPGSLIFNEVNELSSICEFNGGYALLGNTNSKMYIFFVDKEGNRTTPQPIIIDDSEAVVGKSIVNVDDNRFAVVGNLTVGMSGSQVYFVLYDIQDGKRANTEYHWGPNESNASAEMMIKTSDGGFAIAGSYNSDDGEGKQALFLKTNHLGEIK